MSERDPTRTEPAPAGDRSRCVSVSSPLRPTVGDEGLAFHEGVALTPRAPTEPLPANGAAGRADATRNLPPYCGGVTPQCVAIHRPTVAFSAGNSALKFWIH